MLTSETRRSELMARVMRKEYLARMCELGKITPEDYLKSINAIRAEEQLPPLSLDEAKRLVRQPRRQRAKRRSG